MKKITLDRMHNIMYSNNIERETPLEVVFYETQQGKQPCRDFLLALEKDDRREVGADIFAAQKGFPLGLPLCRKMNKDYGKFAQQFQTEYAEFFLRLTATR